MKVIPKIFAAFALILLVIAGYLLFKEISFRNSSTMTQGTVIEMVWRASNRTNHRNQGGYAPVVSFTANDGKQYTVRTIISSNPPSYSVGDKADVYYDPSDPNKAELGGASGFLAIYIVGGIGLFFLFFAIVFRKAGAGGVSSKENSRIIATGTPGTATIISVKETGMTVKTTGTLPKTMVKIELQVNIPGTPTYTTSIQTLISMLEISQLQIGKTLYIKADPLDKMKVVLNPNPVVQPAGNPENLLKDGYKGVAELKAKTKTSQVKNGYSVYALQFEITREGVEAYIVDKEVPLPDYEPGRFDVGRKLACLIDFNDKNKLTMEI